MPRPGGEAQGIDGGVEHLDVNALIGEFSVVHRTWDWTRSARVLADTPALRASVAAAVVARGDLVPTALEAECLQEAQGGGHSAIGDWFGDTVLRLAFSGVDDDHSQRGPVHGPECRETLAVFYTDGRPPDIYAPPPRLGPEGAAALRRIILAAGQRRSTGEAAP